VTFSLSAAVRVEAQTLAVAVGLVNTFFPQVYIYPLPLIQLQSVAGVLLVRLGLVPLVRTEVFPQ
jgi:hypothetical protein